MSISLHRIQVLTGDARNPSSFRGHSEYQGSAHSFAKSLADTPTCAFPYYLRKVKGTVSLFLPYPCRDEAACSKEVNSKKHMFCPRHTCYDIFGQELVGDMAAQGIPSLNGDSPAFHKSARAALKAVTESSSPGCLICCCFFSGFDTYLPM
jgi:hypothetical protein